MMTPPTPNPRIQEALKQARDELKRLRDEKTRLYPPNPHPFAQKDRYPQDYTPEQIKYHNELDRRIQELEERIEGLQTRLYSK